MLGTVNEGAFAELDEIFGGRFSGLGCHVGQSGLRSLGGQAQSWLACQKDRLDHHETQNEDGHQGKGRHPRAHPASGSRKKGSLKRIDYHIKEEAAQFGYRDEEKGNEEDRHDEHKLVHGVIQRHAPVSGCSLVRIRS